MKSKKRGIAFAMAVIMIVSMIPFSAFGDARIDYSIERPDVGVMNKVNSANESFRKAYLRSGNQDFNLVYKFNRTWARNVKGAENNLSYNTSMIHYENGSMWGAIYEWTYQKRVDKTINGVKLKVNEPTAGNKGIDQLFAGGEIEAELSADLTADLHRNLLRHDSKILDRACAALYHNDESGDYSFITIANDRNAPDESPVNTTGTQRIDSAYYTGMKFHFQQLGCECGSSRVSRVSLGLIDKTEPVIRSIYASSDADGKNKETNGFNAGETGYLNLQFSENIRFSNDQIPENDIFLNLIINGAMNNIQVNTTEVQARLISLKSNKMVFKFTVPEEIAGSPANVYISGIANAQDWVNNIGGVKNFPLTLLGKDGKHVTLTGSCATDEELTRTSSLVTDIAGNPINWQRSTKTLSEFCFLDHVAPAVTSVEIQGARISEESNQTSQAEDWPDDIDRSTVFAGIGDTLTFSVKFSEEMVIPQGVDNVTAVLDGNEKGVPITIKGKSIDTVSNGVNGIKVSKITFEPLKITEDMTPDGNRKPFRIEKLSFPSETTDLRGNAIMLLDNSQTPESIPAPKQQQYLDTQLPAASTGITASGGKYAPIFYTTGDKKTEFYFPVTVSDVDNVDASGHSYMSGSNGVYGSFAWLDEDAGAEYPFDYCVSASQDKPADDKYVEAMTSSEGNKLNKADFEQVETGNYIHIRLRDDVKYNMNNSSIIILGGDYAQNRGHDEFKLDYSADFVPPEISKSGEKNSFNGGKGTMEVTVSLKDPSGINPTDIEYQWAAADAEAVESAWTAFTGESEAATSSALKVKIIKENLQPEHTHEYDLLVRARDGKGNISEEPARIHCVYDLEKANPNLEIKDGFDMPVNDIVIGMELDMYSGNDSKLKDLPATSVLMIKNPDGEEDEYFINVVSARDGWLDTAEHPFKADDIFNARSDYRFHYTDWYSAKVTENNDGSFSLGDSRAISPFESSEAKKVLNSIINHEDNASDGYYGDVDIIFVTAYGDTPLFKSAWLSSGALDSVSLDFDDSWDNNTTFHVDWADGVHLEDTTSAEGPEFDECFYYKYTEDPDAINTTASAIVGKNCEIVDEGFPITSIDGNLNVQKYTFKLATKKMKSFVYYRTNVEFIDALQADGTPGLMFNDDEYTPGGPAKYLKNLDGARISFKLSNPEEENWGITDMDFDSPETYAALYYTEHGTNPDSGRYGDSNDLVSALDPISRVKLKETDKEQYFTIPYGATSKTGFYTLEISVKPLSSDKAEKFYFADMYADGAGIELNGIYDYIYEISGTSGTIQRDVSDINSNNLHVGTAPLPDDFIYSERTMELDIKAVEAAGTGISAYKLCYYKKSGDSYNREYMDKDRDAGSIKIWNAASTPDGSAPDYVQWYEAGKYYPYSEEWYKTAVSIRTVDNDSELGAGNYGSVEYLGKNIPVLPLIKDGSNAICFQVCRSNGEVSKVMQLNITASSQAPEFALTLDSSGNAKVPSVTASAENIFAVNGAKIFNFIPKYGEDEHGQWGDPDKKNMDSVQLSRNGTYYFYVADNLGNVSIKEQTIDWIDGEAPAVSVKNITSGTPENEFHAKVTMKDNNDLSEGRLFLTFDKDYSLLLNKNGNDEAGGNAQGKFASVEVPLSNGGTGEWRASGSDENHGGIYKTEVSLSDNNLTRTVEIWGAFKYDGDIQGNEQSERILTFTGSDQAGNISKAYETEYVQDEEDGEWHEVMSEKPVDGTYVTVNAKNIKPEFSGANLKNDKVKLNFTAPVLVTSPNNSNPVYDSSTDSVSVYNDGKTNISFRDLFGTEYKQDASISVFGQFNAIVKFSETEPTQNNVEVYVEIPKTSETVITGMKSGAVNAEVSADKKSASMTMEENGTIMLSMKAKDGTEKDRNIVVSNIDKRIEDVMPYWYYANGEPAAGEAADGPVTVGLYCSELLTGTNGPLTYTFMNGAAAGAIHTFEYEDLAKNKGSLTVTLMHDVVYTLAEDTAPPEYSVAVYSKLDYTNKQGDSYQGGIDAAENQSFEEAMGKIPSAQGYMLMFNVFDESKVKLIVKTGVIKPAYDDTSDFVDGVAVSDRVITADKNAEFNIYLVDEIGNATGPLALKFDKIDNVGPTGTVEYAASTFYSTTGYLRPSEFIKILNISGVEMASEGTYKDLYYHKYEDNEDFVFYYKDEVGNTGETRAKVDWLDVNPPEVVNLKWTPVGAGQNGEQRGIYAPPSRLVNRDVMAQAEFNKTVQDIQIVEHDKDIAESSPDLSNTVSVEFIQNGAVITYKENAEVDLLLKSYNGKESRFYMGKVECIDKTKPVITTGSHVLSSDKQSIKYTFTSSEDVYMAEGKAPEFAKEFNYTFTANGEYEMHFTDKAGNSVVHKVTVKDLDKEKMKVYFNTVKTDEGAVDFAAKLNMEGKDKFYVKLSKDGKVTYDGKTEQASKNVWIEFNFINKPDKFFYQIDAVDDSVGTKVVNYIGIEPPDNVPPAIILPSAVISLKQGSTAAEITEKLYAGVSVSDNKDTGLTAAIKELTAESGSAVQITDDMAVGRYRVEYTAADTKGNTAAVYRVLRIYGKDMINAMINGLAAEPEGTMVLNTQDIMLNVENLPESGGIKEPCRVSYKAGIMTAGQMKIKAVKVETDKFTLPGTGFYTIYIQAQDRRDYITYVYIEK